MRPKLQVDVIYLPVDDGVYIRRNKDSLKLKGKSLYRWLESLVPYLTGEYTLEDITQGLDAERKAVVTQLVEALLAKHFIKDASQEHPHQLSQQELATYASEIAFIDSFQDSAAYRFERFRSQRLLIIGSGLSLTSLVQATLRCGVRQIDVILTSECEAVPVPQPDAPGLFIKNDPAQVVQQLPSPAWENKAAVRQVIQGYGAVLHISDRPMLARARMLNNVCFESSKLLIQTIIVGDEAWIGPLVGTGNNGCWECAWRRMQAQQETSEEKLRRYAFCDAAAAPISRFLVVPTAGLAANRLVFELFKYLTQAGPVAIEGSMVAIDLATILTNRHAFLAHPHCQTCQHVVPDNAGSFLARIHGQQQKALDLAEFSKSVVSCIDNRLGLFTAVDENDFVQAPLAICQVTLSNPMLQKQSDRWLKAISVGADFQDARIRAIQHACEMYAAYLFDQRRLLTQNFAQQNSSIVIAEKGFLESQAHSSAIGMWSWGLDLHMQRACLVPASLVFTPGRKETEHIPGIASGQSWDEALCRALFQWSEQLTLADLADTQHLYPQVDLNSAPMTSRGLYLHDLLKSADEVVTVYDVTGTLQIPVFALCLEKHVVAYSTHCDVAQALENIFEQAVQHYQSLQAKQPEYGLEPVADLPLASRGDYAHIVHEVVAKSWSEHLHWLLKKFQARGLRAIAVPLDHDPACAEILPTLVHVLVARTDM